MASMQAEFPGGGGPAGWKPWPGAALAAGFVAGCALQLGQGVLWAWPVYGVLVAVPGLAWVGIGILRRFVFQAGPSDRRVATWARVLLWMACAMAVGFGQCGLRASAFARHTLAPALEGHDLLVTGMVAAMPQRGESHVRFLFDVATATREGVPVALPARLQLGWYGGVGLASDGVTMALQRLPPELRPGERWRFVVRLKAVHGSLNPHGFDHELRMWEQGVQAAGYVRTGPRDPQPQRLARTAWHPVEQARLAVRDAILGRLDDGTAARQRSAGVVAALVTGDQAAIDRADWDVFRATGVAHLMSISGLHITLFAWLAGGLTGALWRRSARWGWPAGGRLCLAVPAPTAGLVGGVALAAAYAVFSGWGVPAQRTICMLGTVSLLRMGGCPWPWSAVWLLAGAVVVALDPWALMQAGFWLSFVAVGVLFSSEFIADNDQPTLGKAYFLSKIRRLLREQGVVTLALAPLGLLLFHQVSLVGFLANLLAIPWVTLVVTPMALAGVVAAPLWSVAAMALGPLAALLDGLARLPFATLSVAAAPWWVGVAGVAGGMLCVARLPWRWRVLGLPLLLPVVLWQAPRPAQGEFELLAADIGQGNAVLVRTAGHALLYDAGPKFSADSDAGQRVLVPLMRALGEQIDMLVLSHRDSDHTGGAAAVLAMQSRAGLLSSMEPDHALQALRPARRCQAGQRWTWDGVVFELLHPAADDYARPLARPNALSCVLRVSNGSHAALLAGDIESAQEARLVAAHAATDAGGAATPLRADVLLVPHHGSTTSSTGAFLDAVQPRWALVQAGYRNRFGHPALPVLARYRERDITVVDSARCGAARWSSAQPQAMACERELSRRYWQHRP